MARVVEIPYKPRNWAKALHASFRRFAAIILHRRAGKTTCIINHHLRAALNDDWERQRLLFLRSTLTESELKELIRPPGGRHYGHVMPTRVQAKSVAWDKLKYYAAPIKGAKTNESELLLKLPNGHKIQLFGADDPDALRGLAFSGLSFDEYSQQPQNIYSEVLSKALGDHLGYGYFVGTVKGKDHLWRTHEAARQSPDWFSLWQDIDRSLASEDGITVQVLQQAMDDDRKQVAQGLMTQDEFDQEWYLSVDASIKGAFYLTEMQAVKARRQIGPIPYDRALPVNTDWDLGIDAMAIWFSQTTRSGEVRLIDYYEDVGGGLPEAIKALKGKPYIYGEHWAPHDIEVREISSGLTRRQAAASLGVRFNVTPKIEIQDGITAAKLLLPRCFFDEVNTARGIECLRHYRKTWNQRLEQFTAVPVHDWASHGADAFRGLAVRHRVPEQKREQLRKQQIQSVGAWS